MRQESSPSLHGRVRLEVLKFKAFVREHIPIAITVKSFLWRLRYLPYLFMAIPCVALLRIIKFWLIIRIGKMDCATFGHCWSLELYLCERDIGWQEQKNIFDIFYTSTRASNQVLLKKWQEHVRLFNQNKLIEAIDIVNRWFTGYENHVITVKSPYKGKINYLDINKRLLGSKPVEFAFHQDVGTQLLIKTKPHLTFTQEEAQAGKKLLKDIGIPENAFYVCFHARDSKYKNVINSKMDWSYHDFRDANIKNYLLMAEKLTMKGIYMVRMGAEVSEQLNTENPMIIDYPVKYRSEFMDLYIGSNSKFYITSLTGNNIIPTLFRKPTLLVNVIPYNIIYYWTEYDLFLPKKLWLSKENRFLSFREIFESEVHSYFHSIKFARDGIEVIENTPEEIAAAALEIHERLNRTWASTEEDEVLQRRFWLLYKQEGLNINGSARIGTSFLRQNKKLLE